MLELGGNRFEDQYGQEWETNQEWAGRMRSLPNSR